MTAGPSLRPPRINRPCGRSTVDGLSLCCRAAFEFEVQQVARALPAGRPGMGLARSPDRARGHRAKTWRTSLAKPGRPRLGRRHQAPRDASSCS